jgi:hypothetical protein
LILINNWRKYFNAKSMALLDKQQNYVLGVFGIHYRQDKE